MFELSPEVIHVISIVGTALVIASMLLGGIMLYLFLRYVFGAVHLTVIGRAAATAELLEQEAQQNGVKLDLKSVWRDP